ncbi:MAG TPA: M23 family metallopeptidase [Candidatus Acidoferrales bacterium]|nr:M23 family metallopeptidase [Candidatus Acidoferrales bacterium]
MKPKSFTFLLVSGDRGNLRKVRVPFYVVHLLAVFVVVGGITVFAAVGSYGRMLWKAASYNALRRDQEQLKRQFQDLQARVKDSDRKISSLQSLATDVAMSYGILGAGRTPFFGTNNPPESDAAYNQSVEQFHFLMRNATAVALSAEGMTIGPGRNWEDMQFTPSLWPVVGPLTGTFGERLDPFSGEGAFHAGVDISAPYGTEVRVAADGIVEDVGTHTGLGRAITVDHGFGIETIYGHLSRYGTEPGKRVKRGEVIGFVGDSGRATGPHLHFEVHVYGTPVNPLKFLRSGAPGGASVTGSGD